ncbi:MAG: nicotinate-nucleotide adenylyltransferase [Acidobacteriota bacterium]
MPARLGLLGGTFDPIHLGHRAAALAAAQALALDEVRLVPAHLPPHRPTGPRAADHHRFAMAALVVMDEPTWTVSDSEMARAGASYTYDTLSGLHQRGLAATQIFFLIGADAFAEIATWSRYPDVLDLAHFVVVARPGVTLADVQARVPALASRLTPAEALATRPAPGIALLNAQTPDVSSTDIRARAADGRSLSGLVPASVDRYIRRHGLYGSRSTMVGALHGQDE